MLAPLLLSTVGDLEKIKAELETLFRLPPLHAGQQEEMEMAVGPWPSPGARNTLGQSP